MKELTRLLYVEMEEKFWSRVEIHGTHDCWLWKVATAHGYGVFKHKRKCYQAHQLAYILANNDFKVQPYEIVHTCKNRSCCNPSHLIRRSEINFDWAKLERKFWDLVEIGNPHQCWNWKRKSTDNGYGYLRYQKKRYKAHRLAYIFHHHIFNMENTNRIFHTCNNLKCCNPDHLHMKIGIRGENNMNVKLTREQVFEIRRLHFAEKIRKSKLAKMYNISVPEIVYILRKQVWKWLSD